MAFSAEQLALLGRQHWVASVEQLQDLGVSPRTMVRMRNSGVLSTILPGVVRLAAAAVDDAARQHAATLYVGGLCALTNQSAGGLYGLRRMHSRLVHVMVEEPRKPRAARWIQIHRSSWLDAADIVRRDDGLLLLSPMRLLFEMAAAFPKEKFRGAAEDMWHRQLIDPQSASAFLREIRRQGRTGVRRFEEWLEETELRTSAMMSGLEVDLFEAMSRVGLPVPLRQHEVVVLSGDVIHLDFAFPEVSLGVEPGDSWWHGGNVRMRGDYARDLACAAVGWQIIRFDQEQLRNPQASAEQVRRAYQARRR